RDGSVDLGVADREFRRLQPGGGGDRDGLYPRPRGGFPAGDAWKAAAGVVVLRRVIWVSRTPSAMTPHSPFIRRLLRWQGPSFAFSHGNSNAAATAAMRSALK